MENNKEIESNLRAIKFLLAGIILDRKPNIKEVAKIVGCSDNTLTALYPERKKSKKVAPYPSNEISQKTEESSNEEESAESS